MWAPTGPDGRLTAEARRRVFDRGAQRFDAGDFHGAEEDWEPLWHEASGAERAWLLGLVRLAAAFHHLEAGQPTGYEGLLLLAAPPVPGVDGAADGVDDAALRAAIAPWVEHARRVAAGADLSDGAPPGRPRIPSRPGHVRETYPDDVLVAGPRDHRA